MSLRKRIATWLAPETRLAYPRPRYVPTGGVTVDAVAAENLATVTACVNAISNAIASLPAIVYRTTDTGRVEVADHPVARLVREGFNPHLTWAGGIEWLMGSTLLRGDGLAWIETDSRGAPVALSPVPWDQVAVSVLPSGRLAYDIVMPYGLAARPSDRRRLLEGEVLHLRDRTDDGLVGRSRLSRAYGAILAASQTDTFARQFFANGTQAHHVLKAPGRMKPDQVQDLREQWEARYSGLDNAHKPLILTEGLDVTELTLNAEDAQVLATRRFSVEEIARVFNVPPPLAGDFTHSTFTNSETAGRWFASYCLLGWITKLSAEFGRALIGNAGGELALDFDLSVFLRGDDTARWQAHKIAIETGALTVDEVRELEGYGPRQLAASSAALIA